MFDFAKKEFDKAAIVGKRIELISTTDEYTTLRAGAQGIIDSIDDMGTIFVIWDNRGGNMGLIPGIDRYKIL